MDSSDGLTNDEVILRVEPPRRKLKIAILSRKGSLVELLPANPDFQPIVVDTRNTPLEIEGLAVGLIRNDSL